MKKHGKAGKLRVLAGAGFILCSCLLLYPTASNLWNAHVDRRLISRYEKKAEQISDSRYVEMIESAAAYNQQLAIKSSNSITGKMNEKNAAYEEQLNLMQDGVIGYIEIPCINLTAPVYHYSTEDSLSKGIGHISTSSLPIGGTDTHAVLTGHRGLPNQKLFTDLDKIREGDIFSLHVLGRKLYYRVSAIQTVEPEDTDILKIEKDQDLVTLVTCTPYGINTHRLLITGQRVPHSEAVKDESVPASRESVDYGLIAFAGFTVFLGISTIINAFRKKKERRRKHHENSIS